MKVGIAGAGFMGSTHAAGWAETPATLAGFVAETTSEAEKLARKYGARAFADLGALLEEVDVLDICTPTHLHSAIAIQAASAGKNVVCEKPLARTTEQARAMIEACQRAKVKLLVAHVVRFFPEYARAKAIVQVGEIGRPAVIRLARGSYRPRKPAGNWMMDPEKSGGVMLDLMVHDFDYARWISGAVKTVYAKSVLPASASSEVEYGLAILTHAGGALSHIAGAWAYPPPTFRTSLEIAGDAGLIEWSSDQTAPLQLLLHKDNASAPDVGLPSSPLSESPFTTEIKEFYAALAGDEPVRVAAEDGAAAVQIALAAIESARSGKPVRLAEVAG